MIDSTIYFILKYPTGFYLGVDEASGGYPYTTDRPDMARWWRTAVEAVEYRDKFPNLRLTVCVVRFDITPVM